MVDRWRDTDRHGDRYARGYPGSGPSGDVRRERGYYGDDDREQQSFTSGPRYSQGSNAERYGVDERSLYQNWGGDERGRSYDHDRGASRSYGDYRPERGREGRQEWRGVDLGQGRFESERAYDQGATGRSYGGYDDPRQRSGPGRAERDYYQRDSYRGRDDERGFFEKAGDEVRSWFGDDEAEQRRRLDQYRGHGPRGYTRSDERIREDVCDRLSDDPRVDASDIEVLVANGEVTLTGNVQDRQAKRRVEDLAEDISGVRNVQNGLRVKQSWGADLGSATGTPSGSSSTSTLPSPANAKGRDTL